MWRGALLLNASILALAAPSAAQTPATTQTASADTDEGMLVVTGSRLLRDPNSIEPLPVSTLDAAAIQRSGATDATAVLRTIPALISSSTVADSIERGPANTVGQATINLRQLGANRTLVLVDGYRHVSGVAGSQTVDVSTIPPALIERVDVLTGGASAIYGADAVTGVVNYVLKKDYQGFDIDVFGGISDRRDGASYRISGSWGRNFADGRGNVTLSFGYSHDDEVLMGARDFTRDNGRANNSTTYANPLRRFQQGDISAATPNFASRFSLARGRFPYGFAIPTAAQFATFFPGVTPTAAEQALIDRAANAPTFVIGARPVFAISSNAGLITRADFGSFSLDLNNNGTNDCDESYIGNRFGYCYVSTAGGGVRPFRDGIISTGSNQFGGDGAVERTNETSLTPTSDRIFANLRGRYEFSDLFEAFVDAKYTRNRAVSRNNYNTFYDSLLILPDNPYIPAALQAEANDAGGLRVGRDFLDLGPGIDRAARDTYRLVGGLRGAITDHLRYELVGNYGHTDNTNINGNTVRYDRLFAALDAVRAPDGRIVCRSDLNANPPYPGSEFFPEIAPGYFTFTPGDGSCRPANILNGVNSVSQDAVNFITTPTTNRFTITQTVVTASVTGDTGGVFELPGGAIQFAAGGEYRRETSRSSFDPLVLGLLPEGSPAGPAGTFIGDISPNQSLTFDAQTRTFNAGGAFHVWETFGEIRLPILKDLPFARELTVGAAIRYADYSTVGSATTWNFNGSWAPVQDIKFRGTYARAIRAPNISELFDPQQGATFRPADPCNQSTIDSLLAANDPNAQNRLRNCRADGIPAGYEDPLTARFSGTSGGNPNLDAEKARTWTVGTVIQPHWVPGLTLSADYYNIEIRDAIQAVTAQDIVNTCYDLATYPNDFCNLFTRNRNASSPTFLGLNFLRQTQLNFARLETSGIDFQVNYNFALGENRFALRVVGNWTEKLNRFFDPIRTDLVNPGLKELGAPEWSGFGSLTYSRGPVNFTYNVQYIGQQGIAAAVQIERLALEFGPAGLAPEYWVHGLAFDVAVDKRFTLYGGVNNLTDAQPYLASSAYPVSGVGRYYFLGARARF